VSGSFEARFLSQANWWYQLEHSADLGAWNSVGDLTPGTGGGLTLTHLNPQAKGFYRVRAERP